MPDISESTIPVQLNLLPVIMHFEVELPALLQVYPDAGLSGNYLVGHNQTWGKQ
jgi:hypothetical protein